MDQPCPCWQFLGDLKVTFKWGIQVESSITGKILSTRVFENSNQMREGMTRGGTSTLPYHDE